MVLRKPARRLVVGFWLMFAYNLGSALYTSLYDVMIIADPEAVRKNPQAFNPEQPLR